MLTIESLLRSLVVHYKIEGEGHRYMIAVFSNAYSFMNLNSIVYCMLVLKFQLSL